MSVRKWTIPLTFVGLSGLGALLFSGRGRKLISSAKQQFAPGRMAAWNDSAQQELDHIMQAVKKLEQSLETHPV